MIHFEDHPLLHPVAFVARFERPISEVPTPEAVAQALRQGSLDRDVPEGLGLQGLEEEERDALRKSARALLRHGGYKPSGRGKPSSEYLVRASGEGDLPTINVIVDTCNALSLHAGLPISVVDLDRLSLPLRVTTVEQGAYVFNASGQEIRLDGLLCLADSEGPRANAVKDCHATKTHGGTRAVVAVVWAPMDHAARGEATLEAYMDLLTTCGAQVERVGPRPTSSRG